MCGRFAQSDIDAIYSKYRIKISNDLRILPRYNIAPGQNVPIVARQKGKNVLKIMRWGITPSWMDSSQTGYIIINTRAETVSRKTFFRNLLVTRRCVIPASGFYEWQNQNGKIPHYIFSKDKKLLAFAGLYDSFNYDNMKLNAFSIITTDSNNSLKLIHTRMPVILKPHEERIWLDESIQNIKLLEQLLDPYPANLLSFYKVSKKVNSIENDSIELIEKYVN